LRDSRHPVYVASIKHSLNNISSIEVAVPPLAEFETSFNGWVVSLSNLARQTNSRITFNVLPESVESFSNALATCSIKARYSVDCMTDWFSIFSSFAQKSDNCFIAVVAARKGSISHSSKIEVIPRIMSKKLANKSFAIIYPAQPETTTVDTRAFLSGTGQVNIEE
ncbi:MAG: hypothetical protein AB7S54_09265, partial [Bacteroidales bacterium]